jgi:Zn-dependent metalloprotease
MVSGTYFDILTSIDVAAHEIGHAICSNTANLAYQPESGAMNEAFSDIWSLLNIMQRQINLPG